MTSFTSALVEHASASATFASQLEADLATGVRGGNKFRLIARCWVAARYGADCGLAADQYDRFRAAWSRQTFAAIHNAFDHILPAQYRAAGSKPAAQPAPAAPTAKAITRKAEKLARSFERTTDLNAEQRAWVIAQGGVEALDSRRLRLASGRTFPFLDSSWFVTAQHIQGVLDGRKELI